MNSVHAAALDLATSGTSVANYEAIFAGFAAKGIAEADIFPRVNVLTFDAWKAKGRSVKKGERGVRIFTTVEIKSVGRDPSDGSEKVTTYNQPSSAVLFHESQTEPSTSGLRRFRYPTRRCHAGVAS